MSDINESIGIRLRELRLQRQLTLEALSEMTGVSVSMLSAIERGRKSPTLTVLNKINSGMQISLSELLDRHRDNERRVIHKRDMKVIKLKKGCDLQMLLEYDPRNRFEVMRQQLAPNARWDSEPRLGGDIMEYCFPIRGTLTAQVDGERYTIEEGEAFSFVSNVYHSYINETEEPLTVILINAYR